MDMARGAHATEAVAKLEGIDGSRYTKQEGQMRRNVFRVAWNLGVLTHDDVWSVAWWKRIFRCYNSLFVELTFEMNSISSNYDAYAKCCARLDSCSCLALVSLKQYSPSVIPIFLQTNISIIFNWLNADNINEWSVLWVRCTSHCEMHSFLPKTEKYALH